MGMLPPIAIYQEGNQSAYGQVKDCAFPYLNASVRTLR